MVEFITSILHRTIVAGTPLLLATIGEIISERAGVINLGIEGMISLGAVVGFGVSLSARNPWAGLIVATLVGGFLSLIHAFITITLKARQILSGLAISMLGIGISGILGKAYVGVPLPYQFKNIKVPLLSEIPVIGKVLFIKDPVFYISIAVTIGAYLFLFKSKVGINLRSVGEKPAAADAMGVNVDVIRYVAVVIGGCLAGMAGAFLSIVYIPQWVEGMSGGRGWIVIALTIFALWNPLRAIIGSYIFGGIYILAYILQSINIPPSILLMFPYVVTLLALIINSRQTMLRHIGAPEALGEPYIKEEK